MKIRDLALCSRCGRVVAMKGRVLAEHARAAFRWNRCPGSGGVPE